VNELALFAGAGGGLLAGHILGWRCVCAVECDEHAASVLVFPIWTDVRTFDGRGWRGVVDVVSGGFPCQAYSTAAAGKNNADDLWPEMRRIVADVAPRYVFAENVSWRAIDEAANDLEKMGYETRAVSLSAADMGADHVRERFWLLAYADDKSELLRQFDAEMVMRTGVSSSLWETGPDESRMADGLAYRMDRLKATGNGQVPGVVVAALWTLANA